jgi:hypothetical protein
VAAGFALPVLGGLALVGGAELIAYASYKAWDGYHNQPRLPTGQLVTGGSAVGGGIVAGAAAAALAYAQTKAALDALLAQRIATFVNALRASLAAYAAQLNQIASQIRVERARIEAELAEHLALDRIRIEAARHIELPAVGSTTAIITGTVPLLPEGTEAVNNAAAASIPTVASAEADQTSTNPVALAATMVAATSAVETAQPPDDDNCGNAKPKKRDPYRRPSGYRKGVRDKVWKDTEDENGDVLDPLTGRKISPDEAPPPTPRGWPSVAEQGRECQVTGRAERWRAISDATDTGRPCRRS